jgi:hypothetical protein
MPDSGPDTVDIILVCVVVLIACVLITACCYDNRNSTNKALEMNKLLKHINDQYNYMIEKENCNCDDVKKMISFVMSFNIKRFEIVGNVSKEKYLKLNKLSVSTYDLTLDAKKFYNTVENRNKIKKLLNKIPDDNFINSDKDFIIKYLPFLNDKGLINILKTTRPCNNIISDDIFSIILTNHVFTFDDNYPCTSENIEYNNIDIEYCANTENILLVEKN